MSLSTIFPHLAHEAYRITSAKDVSYNCLAWAVGDTQRWWWPDAYDQSFWPELAPRSETLAAFVTAFEQVGFAVCDTAELELGYEKITIYAKGKPTHAERQLPNGYWTSKLGQSYDIEHETIHGIEGDIYGNAVCFMKRPSAFIEPK
jgi:hypothetical protein